MRKEKKQELLIVGIGFALIAIAAGYAFSAELNQAGPASIVAGGSGETAGFVFFTARSVSGLPTALMLYSSDGSQFYLRRGMGSSTLETIPIPVPANQSLIIPVAGYKAVSSPSDTFKVKIKVNASAVAAGDSVFIIPMYR